MIYSRETIAEIGKKSYEALLTSNCEQFFCSVHSLFLYKNLFRVWDVNPT